MTEQETQVSFSSVFNQLFFSFDQRRFSLRKSQNLFSGPTTILAVSYLSLTHHYLPTEILLQIWQQVLAHSHCDPSVSAVTPPRATDELSGPQTLRGKKRQRVLDICKLDMPSSLLKKKKTSEWWFLSGKEVHTKEFLSLNSLHLFLTRAIHVETSRLMLASLLTDWESGKSGDWTCAVDFQFVATNPIRSI